MQKNNYINKERGAITLYVLLACLFFVFILSGIYITSINKLQTQEQNVKQIQENYSREIERKDEIYDKISKGIYVTLYTDGTLGFNNNPETIQGKTVSKSYGNIAGEVYDCDDYDTNVISNTPWFLDRDNIIMVDFINKIQPNNTRAWFAGCNKILEFKNTSNLDMSNNTDMASMFQGCTNLKNLDVTSFNTINVKDMSNLFRECRKLLNLDVSEFDTSNVENMFGMFCDCNELLKLDVSKFNTSKVKDMQGMFARCYQLTDIDVSNFDTSNVENMYGMFSNCSKLTQVNVKKFNTSKVKTFADMFFNCTELTNLDLSNFDVSSIDDTSYGSYSNFNFGAMFKKCVNLKTLDISSFDFRYCTEFKANTFESMPLKADGCKIYVKDTFAQEFVLNTLNRPSDWDTSNIIVLNK